MRPTFRTQLFALTGALALLAACGGRGELYTRPLQPLPLLAAGDALISVVPETRRAVLVPADGRAAMHVLLSEGARAAALSPDLGKLLVLGGTVKEPLLDVVDLGTQEVTTLSLFGPFDVITFSPDGALAVLSYAVKGTVPGLAARNLNELALVDLGAPGVLRVQLDTESLAPRSIVFAPVQPDSRRIAVTLDRGVAVFDALLPDRSPRRISLRPPGSTTQLGVSEAHFSPDARFLFVRASGLDDVVVVELGNDPGTGELTAALNFVGGGSGLSDIALPGLPELPHAVLAVYADSREGVLLDAFGLQDRIQRVTLPERLSRVEPLAGGRAVFFDPNARSVLGWDLTTSQSGTAVLDLRSEQQLFAPQEQKVLFTHPGGSGGSPLSVVTLEEAAGRLRPRIQSIQLSSAAGPATLAPGGRLFLTTNAQGHATLVGVELQSLALQQVEVEGPAQRLLHLPAADAFAIVHSEEDEGDVTLVSAGAFERAAATRVRGFNLTGAFDRPEDHR